MEISANNQIFRFDIFKEQIPYPSKYMLKTISWSSYAVQSQKAYLKHVHQFISWILYEIHTQLIKT